MQHRNNSSGNNYKYLATAVLLGASCVVIQHSDLKLNSEFYR